MSLFKKKKDEPVKVADIAGAALAKGPVKEPETEYFQSVHFYSGGAIVWLFKRVGEEVQLVSKKSFS